MIQIDDKAAFLRTICENPEDDTPRLVFADWLQENNEEDRAEFIRWQCDNHALRLRASSLTPSYLRTTFSDALSKLVTLRWENDWEWHRGFIREIHIHWSDWIRLRDDGQMNADVILAHYPIREVHFRSRPRGIHSLKHHNYHFIYFDFDGIDIPLDAADHEKINLTADTSESSLISLALRKRWPGAAPESIQFDFPEHHSGNLIG